MLTHYLLGNFHRKGSDSLADFAQSVFLLNRNLGLGIGKQFGTFFLRLVAGFLHNAVARSLGLLQDLCLTVTRLLQQTLALLLYASQTLVCLMRLAQRLVNIILAVVHHLYYNGETKLAHQQEDGEESQEHPEEQTQIGGKNGWKIDGIHRKFRCCKGQTWPNASLLSPEKLVC